MDISDAGNSDADRPDARTFEMWTFQPDVSDDAPKLQTDVSDADSRGPDNSDGD